MADLSRGRRYLEVKVRRAFSKPGVIVEIENRFQFHDSLEEAFSSSAKKEKWFY
jgi:hypothetical protein